MNILALETATDACSVALLTAHSLAFRHEIAPRRHTDLILGMIDNVLRESQLTRHDIGAVAFGDGPGSFTGVRIAASVAQGIALGRALPVAAVSTLRALAAGAARHGDGQRVLVALDARRHEIYFAAYDFSGGKYSSKTLIDDTLMAPEDVLVPAGGAWLTAGNGWRTYQARFKAAIATLPAALVEFPDARDIARLAAVDLAAGRGLKPEQARPRYLRGAVD